MKDKFIFILAVSLILMFGTSSASANDPGKAADFTLEAVSGGNIKLSDILKEKKAVLVFSATWCPYCVKEIPVVNAFYAENKDKVAVIGIDIQESKEKVASFTQKKGVTYSVALDLDGAVATNYGVRGIPYVVAIGQDSTILYAGNSIEEMKSKVKL